MNSKRIALLGLFFLIGAAAGIILSGANPLTEYPLNGAVERSSPADTITEDQIRVYRNGVQLSLTDPDENDWLITLDLQNPSWSTFTDTNSMDPVIDKGANTIRIKVPCEELQAGDIVSYQTAQGIIIHRIVHIDTDEEGLYFVLKGDNNPASDPGKVRCGQILGKVVAILY